MTKLEELLKQQIEITAAIAMEVKKCEEAAIKGDSEKQFLAAVIHYKGEAVKQNFAEAFKFFKLAATKEHTESEFFLGDMSLNGQGTAQNDK